MMDEVYLDQQNGNPPANNELILSETDSGDPTYDDRDATDPGSIRTDAKVSRKIAFYRWYWQILLSLIVVAFAIAGMIFDIVYHKTLTSISTTLLPFLSTIVMLHFNVKTNPLSSSKRRKKEKKKAE